MPINPQQVYDFTSYIISTWPDYPNLKEDFLSPHGGKLPEPIPENGTTLVRLMGKIAFELDPDNSYDEGGDFGSVLMFAEQWGGFKPQELGDLLKRMVADWDSTERHYSYASQVHIADDDPMKVKVSGDLVSISGSLCYWESGDYISLPFSGVANLGEDEPIYIHLDEIKTVADLLDQLKAVDPNQDLVLVDQTIVAKGVSDHA